MLRFTVVLMNFIQCFAHSCHSPKVFLGELRIDLAVLHLCEAVHVEIVLLLGEPEVLLCLAWIEEIQLVLCFGTVLRRPHLFRKGRVGEVTLI